MFMYTCVLTESCAVIGWCTLAYLYSMLRCMWYVHVHLPTYWLLRCNLLGRQSRTIVAGAQQLDSTWRHLKRWCPQSLQLKVNSSVNATRYTLAYSYMGRHNAKCESSLTLRSFSNTLWRWCWKILKWLLISFTQHNYCIIIITIIIVIFFSPSIKAVPCFSTMFSARFRLCNNTNRPYNVETWTEKKLVSNPEKNPTHFIRINLFSKNNIELEKNEMNKTADRRQSNKHDEKWWKRKDTNVELQVDHVVVGLIS